jgi:microcystin-dependent protein
MARRKGRLESTQLTFSPITAPTATVLDFAGTVAPSGWLLCDGSAVSRTTYATLFATVGVTYGVGNGSTTFNLPDLRGRIVAGKDDMGGTAANRLTHPVVGGVTGNVLGATGGNEIHQLQTSEIPSHTHTQNAHQHFIANSDTVSSGNLSATNTLVQYSLSGNNNADNAFLYGDATAANAGKSGLATATNQSTGGDGNHNNTQPTMILNKIIKI